MIEDVEFEHSYLFTVRQRFGENPVIDCFYELKLPAGITGDQAKVMCILKEDWCSQEIKEDGSAMRGMSMRLRFNSDMYQHICLVRTGGEIDADTLEQIITVKHKAGELMEFLKESEIG